MKHVEKIEQMIKTAVDEGVFPGATWGLTIGGKVITGAAGYKTLFPQREANDLDTMYDMASVSKVIGTTSAVLKLIEDGSLRLFDKVKKYLPRLKHDQLTLWHLLTHCSGMRECCIKPATLKSSEEVWDQLYSFELMYEPGSKIVYSDLNYIMLGKVVEVVSSLSLEHFLETHIFSPLEMYDTYYNPLDKGIDINRIAPTEHREDDVVRGIVRGKVHDETAYILGGVAGHAGIFSTVNDVIHYLQMILQEGQYKGRRIFSKRLVNRLFEVQVSESSGVINRANRRGLGWIINSQNSSAGDLTSYDHTILHTGFTGTNIWIDRYNNVAFVLLSNRVHPTRQNVLHIAFRAKLANYIMAHLEEIEKEI